MQDAGTPPATPPGQMSPTKSDRDFEPDDSGADSGTNSDAESDAGSDANSDANSGSNWSLVHTPSPHADLKPGRFGPTVPRAQSGSPKKSPDAPLDPQRPQSGMVFESLEEAVHFVYQYESRRGYVWKKGENERNKQGAF